MTLNLKNTTTTTTTIAEPALSMQLRKLNNTHHSRQWQIQIHSC